MTAVAPSLLEDQATSKMARAGQFNVQYNEAGQGPVLILLHGGGPGATGYSNFGPRNFTPLAANHRVLLVNQLGYGETDEPPANPTESVVEMNARLVKDLMDTLGIEKASLCGNSLGGNVAFMFAIRYPERIEKLIVMGAEAGATRSAFNNIPMEGIKALTEARRNPTPENFRKFFDIMLYDGSSVSNETLAGRAEGYRQRLTKRGIDPTAPTQALPNPDMTPDLPKIKAPTLILHGRNDRTVSLEGAVGNVGLIADCRLVIFNKAGHWVQYEKADEFNRYLTDFLAH